MKMNARLNNLTSELKFEVPSSREAVGVATAPLAEEELLLTASRETTVEAMCEWISTLLERAFLRIWIIPSVVRNR
jgi:hypothetical protein